MFLRGAADGLNIVVPHGERAYYELRPTIAVPRPSAVAGGSAIDLDGFFGLHPALGPFKRLYNDALLAVIHAGGSPDATRSHFDAQDFMESGTPGVKGTREGWLNRYLAHSPRNATSSFRAVALTDQVPKILSGEADTLAIPDLARFGLGEDRGSRLALHGLERLWRASDDSLIAPTATEAWEAVEQLERIDPARYDPANGAEYPAAAFGRDMLQLAQLIKFAVGLEIGFAEIGGWDHHVNEGGSTGLLANLLRELAAGVEAFVRDLGDRMDDVVLVMLSEFGRTARENGNRGTDHGHANSSFVIGGPVRGGKLYGTWPGLERKQLYEGRDLVLTTDYRDVMGAVLTRHLGATGLDRVFPGYEISDDAVTGLL